MVDGTVRYYHRDQIGSTRALTGSTGAPVATFNHDAYGAEVSQTGTATTPFGYVGEYRDNESGLVYLRARYYDPVTGQFLTRDPLEATTREPYGYAGGNPANMVDPSGLFGIPFTDYCVDIADDNCNTAVEGRPNDVADFAGGVLNGLTLGRGRGVATHLGAEIRWDSSAARVGRAGGTGVLLLAFPTRVLAPVIAADGAHGLYECGARMSGTCIATNALQVGLTPLSLVGGSWGLVPSLLLDQIQADPEAGSIELACGAW